MWTTITKSTVHCGESMLNSVAHTMSDIQYSLPFSVNTLLENKFFPMVHLPTLMENIQDGSRVLWCTTLPQSVKEWTFKEGSCISHSNFASFFTLRNLIQRKLQWLKEKESEIKLTKASSLRHRDPPYVSTAPQDHQTTYSSELWASGSQRERIVSHLLHYPIKRSDWSIDEGPRVKGDTK